MKSKPLKYKYIAMEKIGENYVYERTIYFQSDSGHRHPGNLPLVKFENFIAHLHNPSKLRVLYS